jgi:chitin synthase
LPTYTHCLQIYAFCKVDDVTWGTKGLSSGNNDGIDGFYLAKISFVGRWLLANAAFCYILFVLNKIVPD